MLQKLLQHIHVKLSEFSFVEKLEIIADLYLNRFNMHT